jgi:hypothetical protein
MENGVMSSPYDDDRDHLVPLLESFQASGNHAVSHWYVARPGGGWDVHMRQSLDATLVADHLAADALADEISFGDDVLRCAHCETWVHGANAPG